MPSYVKLEDGGPRAPDRRGQLRRVTEVQQPLGRLLKFAVSRRGGATRYWFAGASLASVLNKIFDLMPPIFTAWFVDYLTGNSPSFLVGFAPRQAVGVLAGLIAGIFFFESLFEYVYLYGFMVASQKTQHRLRTDAYRVLQSRELRFFEANRLGTLLSTISSDVDKVNAFLNKSFNQALQFVVLVIFALSTMFAYDARVCVIGLSPVPFIFAGSWYFLKRLKPRFTAVREASASLTTQLENNISGIIVIQSFGAQSFEAAAVTRSSQVLQHKQVSATKLSALYTPVIRMVIVLGYTLGMLAAGYYVLDGSLAIGQLTAFSMLIQRILWPMSRLGELAVAIGEAGAAATRVFALIDSQPDIEDQPGAIDLPTLSEAATSDQALGVAVSFDNVVFSYAKSAGDRVPPVLRGVSFAVPACQSFGICGATGAGKSSCLKLLLRFYDVDSGVVAVGGHDVRTLTLRSLRRSIALVAQHTYLFSGTIRENICYGEDTEAGGDQERRAQRASQRAQLHDFISSLPDGYETLIGERGVRLSGGQQQRLSIARALFKNSPVLCLDEATSSVDSATEALINGHLKEILAHKTSLIIAHRLSTVRSCDSIVVLQEGVVHEQGTHDELIATQNGVYAALWNVQTGSV